MTELTTFCLVFGVSVFWNAGERIENCLLTYKIWTPGNQKTNLKPLFFMTSFSITLSFWLPKRRLRIDTKLKYGECFQLSLDFFNMQVTHTDLANTYGCTEISIGQTDRHKILPCSIHTGVCTPYEQIYRWATPSNIQLDVGSSLSQMDHTLSTLKKLPDKGTGIHD